MHNHILIPTDGSELSDEAMQYGISLASAANARVTGITVSTPFRTFSTDPEMIEETVETYRKRMRTFAGQYLDKVSEAAKAG